MQIIVKRKATEAERRAREGMESARKAYYAREIRDGARFRSKAGTKAQIKRVLE